MLVDGRLECEPKRPYQDRLEEVALVRFQANSRVDVISINSNTASWCLLAARPKSVAVVKYVLYSGIWYSNQANKVQGIFLKSAYFWFRLYKIPRNKLMILHSPGSLEYSICYLLLLFQTNKKAKSSHVVCSRGFFYVTRYITTPKNDNVTRLWTDLEQSKQIFDVKKHPKIRWYVEQHMFLGGLDFLQLPSKIFQNPTSSLFF